ncbi:MAG: hypothetical protein LBS83_01090 [Holosporales bacterium]|jgi:hypothetical protein|nr:hypothetical protein [Holosporales bacterium]
MDFKLFLGVVLIGNAGLSAGYGFDNILFDPSKDGRPKNFVETSESEINYQPGNDKLSPSHIIFTLWNEKHGHVGNVYVKYGDIDAFIEDCKKNFETMYQFLYNINTFREEVFERLKELDANKETRIVQQDKQIEQHKEQIIRQSEQIIQQEKQIEGWTQG